MFRNEDSTRVLQLPNDGILVEQELAAARLVRRQREDNVLEPRIVAQRFVERYLDLPSKRTRSIPSTDECVQKVEELHSLIGR